MSHIINYVVKIEGEWMLISEGALIREGRLVQNGSKGGRLIGGRRLFERGRLIEDLRYLLNFICKPNYFFFNF